MGLFRNREVRASARWHLAATALFAALGFWLDPRCGLLVLLACACLSAAHYSAARVRYRALKGMAQSVDRALHSGDAGALEGCEEGELGVLRSEIGKMALRLNEQAAALAREKAQLADSLYDISHQLKTPLTSIRLIAAFLAAPDLRPERRMRLCAELKGLLDRVDWLIAALLKLARLDAGTAGLKRERVDAAELIRRAAEPLSIPLELRNQTLSLPEPGGESFLGDMDWSVEALGNLLKNCMEHTPEGGEIRVNCEENALYTQFTIKDSGPGFAPDDLPRLFERFYRGQGASGQSVGIGLSLSRRIAAEQNGTLKAENDPAGGAKFTLRFYKGAI